MLAQVRLVTTLVGGLSVFGFRFYTATQFLPVKSSWLAPMTWWPGYWTSLLVFQNAVINLIDVLRDLRSSALQWQLLGGNRGRRLAWRLALTLKVSKHSVQDSTHSGRGFITRVAKKDMVFPGLWVLGFQCNNCQVVLCFYLHILCGSMRLGNNPYWRHQSPLLGRQLF